MEAYLCIFVLYEAKASMLPCCIVHGDIDVLDVAKRDERRVQYGFIDVLFQATHIEGCLLVRALASHDNCASNGNSAAYSTKQRGSMAMDGL